MMASYAFFGFTTFHSCGGCSGSGAALRRPIVPGGKPSCVLIMILIVSSVDRTADPVLRRPDNRDRNIVLKGLFPRDLVRQEPTHKRAAYQWYDRNKRSPHSPRRCPHA